MSSKEHVHLSQRRYQEAPIETWTLPTPNKRIIINSAYQEINDTKSNAEFLHFLFLLVSTGSLNFLVLYLDLHRDVGNFLALLRFPGKRT